jgi:tRNA(His) 5'-end guanylyltransferase
MLEGLKQDQRQELLFKETGINWNDYAPEFKRGVVIFKREEEVSTEHGNVIRRKWTTEAAPIFTSEDGRAWLNEILGHSRSAKENVQEKEGIRQDQDAQENQQG